MSSDLLKKLSLDKTGRSGATARANVRLRAVVAVCIVVAAASAGIFWLQGRAITVETASVVSTYPTQAFTRLNATGYVVAQRKSAVAAKTTGRLEWLGVEEGSRVKTGQVIARLENKDLASAVKQAEAAVLTSRASLEQARAELTDAGRLYGRQKELLAQGIISQSDYDATEARFKRAVAGVSGAKAAVESSSAALTGATVSYDYSLIRAPFDAVVLTKNADVGDIITPMGAAANAKAAVVSIADMGSLMVEADVSESNLASVRRGQPCEITLDALPDARIRGRVHTIVPTADRSKASVMIKVAFVDKDERVLPEMSAKVAFLEREASNLDRQARTALNPLAIVRQGGREGVFLVKDDLAVFTPVVRGPKLGDLVEVSGVKSGDRVVLAPLEKLKNGSRISLPEKK